MVQNKMDFFYFGFVFRHGFSESSRVSLNVFFSEGKVVILSFFYPSFSVLLIMVMYIILC